MGCKPGNPSSEGGLLEGMANTPARSGSMDSQCHTAHVCVMCVCVCVPSVDRLMLVVQFASIAAGPESEGEDARAVSDGFYLQTGE